jgi:hypothetical protein
MQPVSQLAQLLMIAQVEQRRKLDARPSAITAIHRLFPTVTVVLEWQESLETAAIALFGLTRIAQVVAKTSQPNWGSEGLFPQRLAP